MKIKQQHRFAITLAIATIFTASVYRSRYLPGPDSAHPLLPVDLESRSLLDDGPVGGTAATPPTVVAPPPGDFALCGRAARHDPESWPWQQRYYNATRCPAFDPRRRTLVLAGTKTYGRTGNRLRSFLRAVQCARDEDLQLGIMHDSWAMTLLLQFFAARSHDGGDGDWKAQFERSLCVKFLRDAPPAERVVEKSAKELFYYVRSSPHEEYVASQRHVMRTLFEHVNTGPERMNRHAFKAGNDMCSGIDALFSNAGTNELAGVGGAEDPRRAAVYSVVHLRTLEEHGRGRLAKTARRTGCDPVAALEMRPAYVRAILAPLGLLARPVVVVTDGDAGSAAALERLRRDPDLGPVLRVVPAGACWMGGDMTLAVMATAFIGNPASTMSGFISRSRVALGSGHNYLYRAKDKTGKWTTVCADTFLC